MRYNHRKAFNNLLVDFGYTAKEVALLSGMNESKISRFRNGKLDLEMGELLEILQKMPEDAQSYFWEHLLGRSIPLERLVQKMDHDQIRELFYALAENWGKADRDGKGLQLADYKPITRNRARSHQ
jgi:hypothetical protein